MASDTVAPSLFELAETDVRYPIPEAELKSVLSSPPFVHISGTFNARDIGQVPGSPIRAGYVFRSGSLESLGREGEEQIARQFGIVKIFDLRADLERDIYPEPRVPGVESVWVPNSYSNDVDIKDFLSGGGEEGYCKMYMNIMEVYAPTFKGILEHIRSQPSEPFLFHCALGRDRTGIAAGLLLSLAGASEEVISLDYMLTRVGSEPVRKVLLERALRDNKYESGLEDPAVHNLCSLRLTTWKMFIKDVETAYGGFQGYVTGRLGITEDDLEQIKSHLRG